MRRQRWGTFSVADHRSQRAFVADALLYDRLIIPQPSDDAERRRWRDNGWAPGRLDTYLRLLGELAIPVDWNARAQTVFSDRLQAAKAAHADSALFADVQQQAQENHWEFNPYHLTRMMLTNDLRPDIPPGEPAPVVVAAYPSFEKFKQDLGPIRSLTPDDAKADHTAHLTSLLAHAFLVPADDTRSNEDLLRDAVRLAQNEEFREQRARLYAWQDQVIQAGIVDQDAVDQMREYINGYNKLVERAIRKVRQRLVFTLLGAGLGIAADPTAPYALAAAGVGLVQFAVLDRHPEIAADLAAPAAMFHTARAHFGWK